jgi:oligopeptide/dipeptide ABC transporter ATP-binding protein
MPLLNVTDLTTHFFTDAGVIKAVDGVTFSINRGETLGLVGESGCGKSVTALSLMRLVPDPPGKIVEGEVIYQHDDQGQPIDLLKLPEKRMREIRGKRLGMIFQEPMTSLNPVYTIGDQVGEAIALHEGGNAEQVKERVISMLKLVGMPAPERRYHEYPHQLSGGMRQRAMIAIALSCKPDLLLADEPTTALDVTIQAQILELIAELQSRLGMAVILVTHDFGVVAEVTERVIVMYAGQFVEEGSTDEVFKNPQHPYTQGLLKSIPPLEKMPEGKLLPTIKGTVPNLAKLPKGCLFQDRCPKVQQKCRDNEVPYDDIGDHRKVRCFFPG